MAGKGAANPIAMIASFAMMLRYSFDRGDLATEIEAAIASVLAAGIRTGDILSPGGKAVSTKEMGAAILAEVQKRLV